MSRHKNIKTKKGFTIIEVVLVLAIAGLIFLMVFIAFPALQRGQKDTQRRDDMARFASQLSQYQANNYGKIPNTGVDAGEEVDAWNEFIDDYLRTQGDTFADPSGEDYTVVDFTVCTTADGGCPQKSDESDTANAYIHVYTNATCSGENPYYKQGNKYVAFTYKLESAGTYCGHN
ncbi:type II secretion system protein [Candidatus Saccharibacteria bacterium]|nr:type II secretion system protein [Candidatus Saccharibacteria bacterium]